MRIVRIICWLCILLVSLVVISQPATILAQGESPGEEKIELNAIHTKLEGTSGDSFEFEIELNYEGKEARVFDLVATGPKDWIVHITPSYPKDKKIRDIRLEPWKVHKDKIIVTAIPPFWLMPDPGEYEISLEATSGEIKSTIKLKAVVTAKYALALVPTTEGILGRYSTSATAGKDNYFSVEIQNRGTGTIDNITFSSPEKPTGWTVEFSPDKIDSLAAGESQTIEVNIKPSPKTIAGDYYPITIKASGKQISESIDIRVSVETPPVGQWVGIGIIVLVIAGLIVIFMRFSRR